MEYDFTTGMFYDLDGRLGYAEPIGYLEAVYREQQASSTVQLLQREIAAETSALKREIRSKYQSVLREGNTGVLTRENDPQNAVTGSGRAARAAATRIPTFDFRSVRGRRR